MASPRQAPDGLMGAWLAILQERHRDVTWMPIPDMPAMDRPGDASPPVTGQVAAW